MSEMRDEALGPQFDHVSYGLVQHVSVETTTAGTELRVLFGERYLLVVRALHGTPLSLDVRPAGLGKLLHFERGIYGSTGYPWTPPQGVSIRVATDAEQHAAVVSAAQREIREGRATHDCGDWQYGLICGACGAWLG